MVTARLIGDEGPYRENLMKADSGRSRDASNAESAPDEQDKVWVGVGIIPPPYEPYTLLHLFEHSSALRQCVDSYATNIDAFGHRFEPVVDLDASDVDERVRGYIYARRASKSPETVLNPDAQLPTPTDAEVAAAKLELKEQMRAERLRLEHFFDYASMDLSFSALRRRARQDVESLGNAYWEVIRDSNGKVCGFEHLPAFTVRHMPADRHTTEVKARVKVNEFDYADETVHKRFRRYVQCFEMQVTYFKEFGDPRVLSARSGKFYKDKEDLIRAEKEAPLMATEVLHMKVHSSKSSYGIPRWTGTMLSVLGSRQAEEVNLDYFENKSVPPMAVLVQGGRMTDDTVKRLEKVIEEKIKGKKNFHKLLVLEAENMGGMDNGRTKIDLKPLTSSQHNDALFQNYDERNIDKVGQSYRLPRMLRGDIRDFNRATADAALEFAESQVFRPERDDFDFMMNRKVLPELNIRYWKFKSNSAANQNPSELADMVSKLLTAGAIVPAEARDIASQIFSRPLQKIAAPWTQLPIILSQGQPVADATASTAGGTSPTQDTLGGAAMNGADQAAAGVVPDTSVDDSTDAIKLTGTDLATCFTVNEVRGKKGNLKLIDGKDDPDGFLTVAEFKAKRIAAGTTTGTAEAEAETGAAPAEKSGDALARTLLTLRTALANAEAAEARQRFAAAQRDLALVEDETDDDID